MPPSTFPGVWSLLAPILGSLWPFLVLEIALLITLRLLDPEATRFFFRRNKIEILTTLFAVIGYAISYFYVQQPGHAFAMSVAISLIAMLVLIYSKTRERDFYFISLRREKDKDDWIGDGTFRYERTQYAYSVTNSHSGFIFPKCLIWSDYKLKFDFKILKTSIGVILRATNLSNMVMMQIFDNGIKPHIRVNGFWQFWEPKEARLEFTKKLNLDDWYTCTMQCDKSSIRIRIFEWIEHADPKEPSEKIIEHSPIFDRTWKIPSGHIAYQTQDTSLVGQIIKSTVPFPINLEYGTFGFRNDGAENALVKDVLIEKI